MKTETFNNVYLEYEDNIVDASKFENDAINTIITDLKKKDLEDLTKELGSVINIQEYNN